MPKKAEELAALQVKRLTQPGFYAVGGIAGLYLSVSSTGSKSWVLRLVVGNKRREIGLGAYPEIPLARAREKARECREQVRQGIDPVMEKRDIKARLIASQSNAVTFDQAVKRYMHLKGKEFTNPKHAAQWTSTLSAYASPIVGNMIVAEIELSHLLKILEPEWSTKTETMNRLRGRIENVLSWATVHGYRKGDNPARWKGNLDAVLPKPSKVSTVRHYKALPWKELPTFMPKLRQREGTAARALEFLIMTASRSGEVRGATWDEINFQEKLWIVPAERMKAKSEHRVPLSDEAVILLSILPRFENSEFIFAAPRGGKLSDMTLSAVLKRMKIDAVPHGFRSTFRDWTSECTSYPNEVCEQALAHTIPNAVEAAYRRGDLLEKRRHMMEAWTNYLKSSKIEKTDSVIPIRRAKG